MHLDDKWKGERKRQAWVRDIRQKQRVQLRKQMKIAYDCSLQIVALLKHPDEGIKQLSMWAEKPEFEGVVYGEVLRWLEQEPKLQISSQEKCEVWCSLFGKVLEMYPNCLKLIIKYCYLPLEDFCSREDYFSPVITFFTSFLKIAKKQSLLLPCEVTHHLQKLLMNASKNFLQQHIALLQAVVQYKPPLLEPYLNQQLIVCIIEKLTTSVTEEKLQEQILIFLVQLTQHYDHLSSTILCCSFLSHLELIIFPLTSELGKLRIHGYQILCNLIKNPSCQINHSFIMQALPTQLAITIEDKEEPDSLRAKAFQLLCTVVLSYEQVNNIYLLLKEIQLFDLVLTLLDQLGRREQQVVKNSADILNYLFTLGEQIAAQNEINLCVQKLNHKNGREILTKFSSTQEFLHQILF